MGFLQLVKACTKPHYKQVGKKKVETDSFIYSPDRKSDKCRCGAKLVKKWVNVN